MSANTALLLVDTQEDFLARPGLTPDRATLIGAIARLLEHARETGTAVIHVQTRVDQDLANAMPHRRASGRVEVIAGTAGAEPPHELRPAHNEPVLLKRFFSAFDAAELLATLRERGVEQLIVAGVHAHACIRDTVTDAYRLGFDVVVPEGAVGSYDSAHAVLALDWLKGRAARSAALPQTALTSPAPSWVQLDPCDQRCELQRVRLTPAVEVHEAAEQLALAQPALGSTTSQQRRRFLVRLLEQLQNSREAVRDAIVRDVAKPIRDAEAEIDYGLALLGNAAEQLSTHEQSNAGTVAYHPRGVVGLITPWNNPFALAVGKIAPALAYGNAVLWKPALAGSRIASLIGNSVARSEVGEWVRIVTGDSGTGDALIADSNVAAISFTGSVPVGRGLIARASVSRHPAAVQAELGGSNAAIVDESADLDAAAADLAAAMFSFSGQRCTAIRRVILLNSIAEEFTDRLVAAVEALTIGRPGDLQCDIAPLIDSASQKRMLAGAASARGAGAKVVSGGRVPESLPKHGCWVEPTLIANAPRDHPLNREEWFGPIATVNRVADFEQALAWHNDTDFGLLGALYSTDDARIAHFISRAEAGILSIGRARPPFAASGPFYGWKASGYGVAEHGRWNREFYSRPQAIYRA